MIFFSNCKINIGLYITEKRPDGYHNLETVFYPLPLFDVLEVNEAAETALTIHGLQIPGTLENNIVLRAYQLLKNDFRDLPPVHFHLLKNIPAGAGLGAGSANGAYALMAINKIFDLALTNHQLVQYALQLGSDCPFFILNQPCFASGRGEIMETLPIALSGYTLVIVNPGIHVSTPWAFSQVKPTEPVWMLREDVLKPLAAWKTCIKNDFEKPVIELHPEINNIKSALYDSGALFAMMSGSGSTVYGLYEKSADPVFQFPGHYWIKTIHL